MRLSIARLATQSLFETFEEKWKLVVGVNWAQLRFKNSNNFDLERNCLVTRRLIQNDLISVSSRRALADTFVHAD